MNEREFDCLIVGNGALGLFLAAELIDRGYQRVAVCGRADRPSGASQAAGAMLGCFAEVTAETLRSPAGRQKFELGLLARRRWPDRLKRLLGSAKQAPAPHVVPDTYVVLNTRGAELDTYNYDAIIAAADSYGEPWEQVDPDEITGLRPRPDSRALRAIRLPEEGAVDGRAVLALVQEQLVAAGVAMLPEIRSLTYAEDRVIGAELSDGRTVRADATVLAAGARSAELLATLPHPTEVMPTFAGLGFAMVTERTRGTGFESVVRTPNRAFACGLHVVPHGDGREYLGATNMVVRDARTKAVLGDVHFLADCAMRQLDEEMYHHNVAEYRVGNRPVTLDGFPLIGWTEHAGLYLLTGTYRDGFHNSPLIAEHVADQLGGGEGALGELFAVGRRPILPLTVEESIDLFVQHRMAAWFEAGAQSPPNMSATALRQVLRQQAVTLYEQLGLDVGLGPDILMHVLGSLRDPHTSDVIKYLRVSR